MQYIHIKMNIHQLHFLKSLYHLESSHTPCWSKYCIWRNADLVYISTKLSIPYRCSFCLKLKVFSYRMGAPSLPRQVLPLLDGERCCKVLIFLEPKLRVCLSVMTLLYPRKHWKSDLFSTWMSYRIKRHIKAGGY